MHRALRQRLAAMGIVAGLMAFTTGCHTYLPGHGAIIRGDWSLELNRVPWIANRTDAKHESAVNGWEPGMGMAPDRSPAGCQTGHSMPLSSGQSGPTSAGAWRGSPRPGIGGFLRSFRGNHAKHATEEAGYHNHPRFHPVPTLPIFSRRPSQVVMAPFPIAPAPVESVPSLQPATPSRSVPELIPPPVSAGTQQMAYVSEAEEPPAAWIFSPPQTREIRPAPLPH